MKFLHQLRSLFRKETLEAEMTEEMRHHVELQTQLNLKAGLNPNDARYAALRQFGNVASIQEQAREARGWLWVEQLVQDLRFAARGLVKSRGFTAVAVLTLAIGIGATTAIFSVVYGVLLEPYPYGRSGEIWAPEVADAKTGRQSGLRVTDYLEMAKLPGVASAMATNWGTATLSGNAVPEIITAVQVTGTAFSFLEVPPVIGRGLTPADFQASGEPEPVTVLSFKLWQRLFNGDPAALGKTLVLDDKPYVIVGVMPPRFGWYTNDGLWVPLSTLDLSRGVRPIVRLKPGVSKEVAGQQLLGLIQVQAQQTPGRFPKDGFTVRFNNYLDVTVASGQMRSSLLLLLFAVGFLLLIVCTNVANLQLARGVGRSREMAVRLALGAGRSRLFRQLLTESVALSLVGGVLGILFAFGLVQLIVVLLPENYVPNESRITLNGWVLGFSTGLAVLTGIVAGLLPAWQCTRTNVNEALKDGGQGSGSHRSHRARHSLVVAQVALSAVLLVGAGLMTLTFVRLQKFDRGLRIENMLLLRVPLNPKRYTTFEQRNGFARDFLRRMRQLPGVTRVTLGVPPSFEARSGIDIPGEPKPDIIALNYVDADYLATYDIPLKAGRYFTPEEIEQGAPVALLSQAAAGLWKSGTSPLGRVVSVDALVGGGSNNLAMAGATKTVTIIGVLADVRGEGPLKPAPTVVFVPYTMRAPASRAFVLRTQVPPPTLLNAIRAELLAMDKEQPMLQPLTFEDLLDQQVKQPRFNMALFSALAGAALALAAMGIYSVLSYAVAQRSREIGVRMALGADRSDVQRLFLATGGRLVAIGLLIGAVASFGLARVVQSQVPNSPPLDPLAFVLALALLAATALLACLIPARRATKVDPMVALRAE